MAEKPETVQAKFYLTPAARARIKEVAADEGMTASKLVESLVEKYLS